MKAFDEICKIIQHIALHPEEKVDYLTVNDFLQMREHVWTCGKCSDAIDNTIAKAPRENEVNVNFGGASEN